MSDINIHSLEKKHISKLIQLLDHFNLITHDIDFNNQYFICMHVEKRITAIGGLEFYFPFALVRSVAVYPEYQGNGYAGMICDALCRHAQRKNIRELYLLTETAEGFFSRHGFIRVDRSTVPRTIKTTGQYSTLCPDNAVVMNKSLIP